MRRGKERRNAARPPRRFAPPLLKMRRGKERRNAARPPRRFAPPLLDEEGKTMALSLLGRRG